MLVDWLTLNLKVYQDTVVDYVPVMTPIKWCYCWCVNLTTEFNTNSALQDDRLEWRIPLLAVGDLKYERIKLLDPRYRFSCFPKFINSSTCCPVVPFVTLALVVYMLPLCLKTSKMAVVDDVSNDASRCRQRHVGYLLAFLNQCRSIQLTTIQQCVAT